MAENPQNPPPPLTMGELAVAAHAVRMDPTCRPDVAKEVSEKLWAQHKYLHAHRPKEGYADTAALLEAQATRLHTSAMAAARAGSPQPAEGVIQANPFAMVCLTLADLEAVCRLLRAAAVLLRTPDHTEAPNGN